MKIGRIFYLIPPNISPCGGIYTRYLHCRFLRKHGYEAYPLHVGDFELTWFEYDNEVLRVSDIGYELNHDDIIVAYEVQPYDGLEFKNAYKIMFVQNWFTIYFNHKYPLWKKFFRKKMISELPGLRDEDKNKNFQTLGYDAVITVSDYVTKYIKDKMAGDAVSLTNGIDLQKYVPDSSKRIDDSVLCLPRKNSQDIEKIKGIVDHNLGIERVIWVLADGLTQDELIGEYQKADIFLATGYPEGFGRPPLEAMACGCTVTGFTGCGATTFMKNGRTALVAPDGDCHKASENLIELLTNRGLKEKIRRQGFNNAQNFGLPQMEEKVINFYKTLESS